MDMLYLHFHLIQSALGQKVETKLKGRALRERSQGRAAMGGREVACLPGGMELPLGWSAERATLAMAKFALSASIRTVQVAADAVSSGPSTPVAPAITSCAWNVCFTDEVPRRPAPSGQVSPGYKSYTKGHGYASETRTVSPRPRPKGCQQRQSRGSRFQATGSACS